MTYLENIISRFGPVPRSMRLEEWLASMENREMRKKFVLSNNGYGPGVITEEVRTRLREVALENGRLRMVELLGTMKRPMTIDDMMTKTGWSKTTVRRAINRAHNEGLVFLAQKKAPQIWERRQEQLL